MRYLFVAAENAKDKRGGGNGASPLPKQSPSLLVLLLLVTAGVV